MTARIYRRRLASFTLVFSLLLGAASAQSRERTGTVDVVIGGVARTFHTHVQKVPENAGEGVENPDVRRMLERLAGTAQHTATWMALEPVVMGGIVLYAAEGLFITISATPPMDAPNDVGEIRLEFELNKATLALNDSEDASIDLRFFPVSWGFEDYYAASEGMLELHLAGVEQVDETTLRIRGSFSGTLSFQKSFQVEYDPDDTMSVTGTFDIEQVGGSSVHMRSVAKDAGGALPGLATKAQARNHCRRRREDQEARQARDGERFVHRARRRSLPARSSHARVAMSAAPTPNPPLVRCTRFGTSSPYHALRLHLGRDA